MPISRDGKVHISVFFHANCYGNFMTWRSHSGIV